MKYFEEIPLIYLPKNACMQWMISEDMPIILSNGDKILIPKGMRFDGRSTPKFLKWLFPSITPTLLAYIIHDYLYIYDYKREEWGDKRAKQFADNEMKYWQQKINRESKIERVAVFGAVVLFGKNVFKKWRTKQ